MHVGSLSLYPLKSGGGLQVDEVDVELCGLAGDRRWAVVDLDGRVVTARENDRLLQVSAAPEHGAVTLEAPAVGPIVVARPECGTPVRVSVSRMPQAIDAGEDAASWMSTFLGQPVRLVWQDDPARRSVSPRHGGLEGDTLNLSDAGPLLLTTTASLDQLNTWIAEGDPSATVPMERFRPNLVVEGSSSPYAEDGWRRIRVGEVDYRRGELCDRCVIPTIEPRTLVHGKEPIRTLARHRRWDGHLWFGVRLIPLGTGTTRVGDRVTVLDQHPAREGS